MRASGNTILITGGGSGIGAALAHEFHAAGNRVIITGRRQAALDAVAAVHPGMIAKTLDMMDAAAIRDFARTIVAQVPMLNVVVHNAGIMVAEEMIDVDTAEATVVTNLLGPIRLTEALLSHLLEQAEAALLTVTSGLAFVPLAATPTYCATKAALHSWTQSMRLKLRDTNVEVVEIAPPGVQTDLMPGHADNGAMMPLGDYIAETMALLRQQPTPPEICVERVRFLRDAERNGTYDQVFAALNGGN